MVIKRDDENNKKNKLLWVSEEGSRLYDILHRESDYSTQVALEGLNQDEIIKMTRLLAKMTKNVVNDWSEVKKGHKRIY
ncbi:hypothetical protein GCM10025879_02260 [Leuconostoc litchii]|nr:hypothetical protein GCM10025879_02260 [Leuconostoc litchii]